MTLNPPPLTLALAALTLLLAPGCGAEEETPACLSSEVHCDGTCIPAIAPTAEAVTEHVLVPNCGGCHQGSSTPEGLLLTDLETLRASISEPSRQNTEVNLIEPGDASKSYMVRKMRNMNITPSSSNGTAAGVMPPGLSLCDAKIKAVEDWINAGAN